MTDSDHWNVERGLLDGQSQEKGGGVAGHADLLETTLRQTPVASELRARFMEPSFSWRDQTCQLFLLMEAATTW